MIWALLIIIVGFGLDRLSKMWIMDSVVGSPIVVIKDFFNLRHLENHGAAFSIMQGKTLFLIIVTSLVSLALFYVLFRTKSRYLRLTLALVLAGALGNLYDRIFRDGRVIDFFEFHFGSYYFPTFNVADCFVVVGTILLAIYILFMYKDDSKNTEIKTDEQGK